ncbi:MAG: radical SAM protein [Bacteroidales bacterium]|nr:radical SAM protein [Bacteroidales bacterium]
MEKLRYKLLLINVIDTRVIDDGEMFIPLHRLTSFQPLSLGIIAALTPKNWDVEIIDENFDKFKYTEADFVGLSSTSMCINRAYDISKEYIENNIPVAIGGVHATLFKEEVSQHCISAIVGEAENVWPQIIEDYYNNNLKSIYEAGFADLSKPVKPRRDVFEKYDYEIATMEFTRGCPFNCSFCGVPIYSGHGLRYKPVSTIIEELKEIKQNYIIFKDDNLIGRSKAHKERTVELFEQIIANNIKKDFLCFVSINIADDIDVIKLARKAGFVLFFIGIETEKLKAIQSIHKNINENSAKNAYKETFKRLHKEKVAVTAAFICGFDTDTVDDIHDRAKFIMKSSLDTFTFTFLTPLPKTPLHIQLEEENRIIKNNYPHDWIYYNFCHLTYKVKNGNNKDMVEVINYYLIKLHTAKMFRKKLFKSLLNTGSLRTTAAAYVFNKHNHVFLKESKSLLFLQKTYDFLRKSGLIKQ